MTDTFATGLEKAADIVAREKPTLHFFGLVHRVDGLPHRWDLLVSSDQLKPWDLKALTYIGNLLQKTMNSRDFLRVSRVITLPSDNTVIQAIIDDEQIPRGKQASLHLDWRTLQRDANFDQVFVLWPKKPSQQPTAV